MIGLFLGLILLWWIFGHTRGLIGSFVGAFLGALVLIGLAGTASDGDLSAVYGPVQLACSAVPIVIVAAFFTLIVPYAIGFASFGWGTGAVLAAVLAPSTGQTIYLLPLGLHALAAAALVRMAMRRIAA